VTEKPSEEQPIALHFELLYYPDDSSFEIIQNEINLFQLLGVPECAKALLLRNWMADPDSHLPEEESEKT
jgi:hypothetical protein